MQHGDLEHHQQPSSQVPPKIMFQPQYPSPALKIIAKVEKGNKKSKST